MLQTKQITPLFITVAGMKFKCHNNNQAVASIKTTFSISLIQHKQQA